MCPPPCNDWTQWLNTRGSIITANINVTLSCEVLMHKPGRFHSALVVNHIHFIFSILHNEYLWILPKDKNTTGATKWALFSHCVLSLCPIVPQLCNKVIFLMSFVGNRGTFTRGYKAMIMDVEFLYHLLYLIICTLGVFVHVFFYSLLVREHIILCTLTHTWTLTPKVSVR